ncbi:MAG: serine/threonine protein kinase [Planctomycetales bacterium]|nr:serine/threonine protein kinase [Planctomycetales bacterium]
MRETFRNELDDSGDWEPADPIGDIADAFVKEVRTGAEPSVEAFAQRYPRHADEIRELLPTLLIMERARDLEEADDSDSLARRNPEMMGRVLGDYRIIRQIGRGGMGVVYEAEQVSLSRRVALKVLPQQFLVDSKQRHRFEREARAAAKLHHTNIVPVFGFGSHEGISYFVMQYIHGLGLDEVLEELKRLRTARGGESDGDLSRRGSTNRSASFLAHSIQSGEFGVDHVSETAVPDPEHRDRVSRIDASDSVGVADATSESGRTACTSNDLAGGSESARELVSDMLTRSGSSVSGLIGSDSSSGSGSGKNAYWQSVARIGIQVADALHYAHQQGVTHRDIKPGNLLLDLSNTVWVTDFGLAKAEDQHNLTHTGDILGTLRYMPPEAFEGKSDFRSDVYSLGITLYELATLKAAFEDSDRRVLMRRITEGDIPRIPSDTPRDLATIIHKAIERDPDHRYQSAQQLKEDLIHFCNDDAIQARPPSPLEHVLRWSRRNRALAASLTGIATLLMTIASIMSYAAVYYRRQQSIQAGLYSESQELGRKNSQLLNEYQAAESKAIQAGAELKHTLYLARMSIAHQAISQHRGLAKSEDLLNDWIPAADEKDLRGWEWYYIRSLCSRELFSLDGHTDTVNGLAWHRDENLIASASDDGTVRVWDLSQKSLEQIFRDDDLQRAICAAWSPDGNTLAIGGAGGLSVWDYDKHKNVMRAARTRDVYGLAWSPDGRRLAVAIKSDRKENPGEVLIYNSDDWTVWRKINGTRIGVYNATIGWNLNGRFLALPSRHNVAIWDLNEEVRVRVLQDHTESVQGVAFNPNGRGFLASASRDASIKIWDLISQQVHAQCLGHTHGVASVAWHPQGDLLASASWDGTARIWNGNTGRELMKFNCHPHHCFAIAWNPNGEQLATAGDDHRIKFWDPNAQVDFETVVATKKATIVDLRMNPANDQLLCRASDGELSVWQLSPLRRLDRHPLDGIRADDVGFSDSGKQIVCLQKDSTIKIHEASTGQAIQSLASAPTPISLVCSTGEDEVIGSGSSGPIYLWNTATGKIEQQIGETLNDIHCIAANSSGRMLAVGTKTGFIHLVDLESGTIRNINVHDGGWIESLAWSPDSKLLLSSSNHKAKLWDPATGDKIVELSGHHETVCTVAWAPDGKRLLTADARGQIILWDPQTFKQALVLTSPVGVLRSVGWSADGMRILSSNDNRFLIWDAEQGYRQSRPRTVQQATK